MSARLKREARELAVSQGITYEAALAKIQETEHRMCPVSNLRCVNQCMAGCLLEATEEFHDRH